MSQDLGVLQCTLTVYRASTPNSYLSLDETLVVYVLKSV